MTSVDIIKVAQTATGQLNNRWSLMLCVCLTEVGKKFQSGRKGILGLPTVLDQSMLAGTWSLQDNTIDHYNSPRHVLPSFPAM